MSPPTVEDLQRALGPFLVRLEAAETQAAEATAKWEQANARAEKLQAARDRDLERYRAKVDADTRERFRANLAVELFEDPPGDGGDNDVRAYQVRLDESIGWAFVLADKFLAFGLPEATPAEISRSIAVRILEIAGGVKAGRSSGEIAADLEALSALLSESET